MKHKMATQPQEIPIAIGHRGAKGHLAENTIVSIQKGMALGAKMIEIDVFQLKSGEIVVFHDTNMARLTGINAAIESINLSDLSQLRIQGSHKIPLLNEVMDVTQGNVGLNIELKGAGTARAVVDLIRSRCKRNPSAIDGYLISSFESSFLAETRQYDSTIPLAVLTQEDPLDSIPLAQRLHAVAIHPEFRSVTKENVNIMHHNGYRVNAYTVNSLEDIRRVTLTGVDGIITDFPERVN